MMRDWIGFQFTGADESLYKVTGATQDFVLYNAVSANVSQWMTEAQLILIYEHELLRQHPGILLDLMSLSKDLKFTKAQMNAIDYVDFYRYTQENGWEYPTRNNLFHMAHKNASSMKDWEAVAQFPAQRLDDYGLCVGSCIRQLAEHDERSMMSVYLELRWKITSSTLA